MYVYNDIARLAADLGRTPDTLIGWTWLICIVVGILLEAFIAFLWGLIPLLKVHLQKKKP